MICRRRLIGLSAAAALAPALRGRAAFAQAWPNRFVRLIAPFPAGGGTDAVGRIIAGRLSEIWGQQVVTENRGGAGSNIGIEAAARSDPDGYTMLIASLPLAVNRFIYPSLAYDAVADFAPVSLICTYPNVMAVPNSSPAKSVREFIDYAKANQGRITFASSGIGTSPHLSGELFKRMAGIEMTHVPYRGVALAMNDLIPGRVDVMFNTTGGLMPQVRAGQVRGLAVTTAERFPTAPDLPTVAESGVPGFDVSSWYAFLVPARTPPDIVWKMHTDTVAALSDPTVKTRLQELGVLVIGSTPAELARHLKSEMEKWAPVIKAAGISVRE
jgi:tripartite-type tricarboxylate transporter receptor subunit TctC